MYKNILFSFIMLSALLLAVWTTTLTFKSQHLTATIQTTSLPDAIMENVVATIMDKEGNLKMKIVTPKMVHYIDNDTSNLTAPQLTLFRDSPEPWYITAKFAKATQGVENVDFWDDVTIRHLADAENPATTIETPTLTVHPNKKIAETRDVITLTQPNLLVHAQGMIADMTSGNIQLLSATRGEYVPAS